MTRRRTGTAAAAGLLALVHLAAGAAAPANAEPDLRRLRAQATALRAELDRLATRQSVAVEAYDEAQEQLQQAITAELAADEGAALTRRAAADQRGVVARRARALYMSGGRLGLTATLLDSSSIGDALSRLHAVETVVQADGLRVDSAVAAQSQASGRVAALTRSRARTQQLRVRAAAALARVQDAVTSRQALLDRTDQQVRDLAAAEQARAEAEALARAQQAAELAGLGLGPAAAQGDADATALADAASVAGPVAAAAVRAALSRLGSPYVWGATGPTTFDCSGLTQWAYRQAGVSLPRTSREQYAALPHVPLSELLPGDLVFYATDTGDPATIHHVGMYLGGGRSVYAPQTGGVVKIGSTTYDPIIGAARPSALAS